MIMIILYSVIGFVLLIALILKFVWTIQFNNEVTQLFDGSAISSQTPFDPNTLAGLPEPVQRYFNHSLKPGQNRISYARVRHNGLFKTGLDKPWVRINGEQYATTTKPGFIWRGKTALFTARDMYIADRGRLVVCLLSIFKIVDVKGGNYDQGELLRWLGESVLYPTNLLPSDRVSWVAIDSRTSKLIFDYKGFSLFYIVTFNAEGEIIQLETKRYMDGERIETWIITLGDYKRFDEVLVPTRFVVSWRLKGGDFEYAKFHITEIEYNISKAF